MILSTCETLPEHEIVAVLGVARGNTIRARHIGHDIVAGLKNIVGGEISEYTKLMAESRDQAIDRMVEQAAQMGADAIVGLRFTTAMIMTQAAEILCYGTAVKVRPR